MKTFLSTFASLAAAFTTTQAQANVPLTHSAGTSPFADTGARTLEQVMPHESVLSVTSTQGEAFEFVLKRSKDTGLLMARHHSHRSHASHRSHYSSRY